MKVKVTKAGVIVPRRLLSGADEVEIRQENGHILVIPLPAEDPLLGLGTDPVSCGLPDAAKNHDAYLYQSKS